MMIPLDATTRTAPHRRAVRRPHCAALALALLVLCCACAQQRIPSYGDVTPTYAPTRTPSATPSPSPTATPRPSATPRPTLTPLPSRTPVPDASVNRASVELREGPGSAYRLMATYPQGTPLTVLGRSSGDLWLKVRTADGKSGWMRKAELQVRLPNAPLAVVQAPPPSTAIESALGASRVLERAGITLLYIPSGEFMMGSADSDLHASECEKPQRRVYLDGFWIARTEVTNAQFQRFIADGGYAKREWWSEAGWQWVTSTGERSPWATTWLDPAWNQPDQPVVGVNWYEADAFARWAGGRLPTDAEWEKAARGTDGRIYPWGNAEDAGLANVEGRVGATVAVGSFPEDRSPYGCLDMAGNAREMVADWFAPDCHQPSTDRNPTGPPSGLVHLQRGGNYHGAVWAGSRCAARSDPPPVGASIAKRWTDVGFRIAQ